MGRPAPFANATAGPAAPPSAKPPVPPLPQPPPPQWGPNADAVAATSTLRANLARIAPLLLFLLIAASFFVGLEWFALVGRSGAVRANEAAPHGLVVDLNHDVFDPLRLLAAAAPPPISRGEHSERQERLAAVLRSAGAAAFVAEPGSAAARYLVGGRGVAWSPSERPMLLVVRAADAALAVVVPAFERRRADELVTDLPTASPNAPEVYVWQENSTAYAALAEAVGGAAAVAVDGETRAFVLAGIAGEPGLRVVEGSRLLSQLRAYKSEAELALLEHANVVAKAAIALIATRVASWPGFTEAQVGWLVERALAGPAGLSDVWSVALFDEAAAFPHGTRDGKTRRLSKQGTLVLVDAGGALHGYQSDVTRTWWFDGAGCGKHGGSGVPPPDEVRRAWETVRLAQVAAMEQAAIPGASCESVDAAARRVVTANHYGEGYEAFTHRLGHGIGLEMHEEPYMTLGNAATLVSPNITFSVEPGVYLPEKLGVRIEDIVCVEAVEDDDGSSFGKRRVRVFGPESTSIDDPFKDHLPKEQRFCWSRMASCSP
ncbi:hypothetical protein HK405_003244 [Cladochytrium tenue]|nr:hypothetical protein HK405_003244 [Cladochytrium tenue]